MTHGWITSVRTSIRAAIYKLRVAHDTTSSDQNTSSIMGLQKMLINNEQTSQETAITQ